MFEFFINVKFKHAIIVILNLYSDFRIWWSNSMSYVNTIPELNGQNYGKWFSEVINCSGDGYYRFSHHNVSTRRTRKPRKGSEWSRWCMGYSRESPWHCLNQLGLSAGTLEYFKLQVPDDYQRFHFRWHNNGNFIMCHRYWVSSNGKESVYWLIQSFKLPLCWAAYDQEIHWWWHQRIYLRNEPHDKQA